MVKRYITQGNLLMEVNRADGGCWVNLVAPTLEECVARLPAILGRRLSADKKLTSERYYDESTGILAVSENG